ncbi:MAG: hypothetical protein FWG42_09865 [Clostridiales bacterium]|nr:hypothetical protein [Clostridiales bacterium]
MSKKEYGDEEFICEIVGAEQENQGEEDSIVLGERCIIEGRLYMLIPEDFVMMPPEIAEIKYPSESRPDITYTDSEGTTTISFILTRDKLKSEDIEAAMEYLQKVFTRVHPARGILSSDIIEGELRVGHFDFISPAIDGEIYNLVFIFSLDGRLAFGAFSCLHLDMATWLETAVQIASTVRIAHQAT